MLGKIRKKKISTNLISILENFNYMCVYSSEFFIFKVCSWIGSNLSNSKRSNRLAVNQFSRFLNQNRFDCKNSISSDCKEMTHRRKN